MSFQQLRRKPTLGKVLGKIRTELPCLREEYQVRDLWVFGSYATGRSKRDSKLDILVEYDRVPGFFRFFDLEEYLTKLVGVEVHLVSKGGPKGEDLQRILDESVAV